MKRAQIFSLVYASEEARVMTEDDLDTLLLTSRAHNARHAITGMLLYSSGHFIQSIEGDEAAVQKLFRAIRHDRRHRDVRVLRAGVISERQFADWSMGFRRISPHTSLPTEGQNVFLERVDRGPSWTSASPERVLLDWFRIHTGLDDSPEPPTIYGMV